MSNNLSNEEKKEQMRHDLLYSKTDNSDLYIQPIHYQKFENIKTDTHCYTYSVRSLGDIKGKKILDLGCGNGWFSVILAKRGAAFVDGIDISQVAIEIAKKRAIVNDISEITNFQVMSFFDMRFPEESFDAIIGLSVLHHMTDKKLLGEHLFRILKPGGKIIFNEPFGNSEILEKIRLLVPVPVMEEDKTHWNEQIKYKDLETFKNKFKVSYKEFQFSSRLDRIFNSKRLTDFLGIFDVKLLENIPFLRRYARDIVIILEKQS